MSGLVLSLVTITLGYLIGSVCSAVIVCQLFGLKDPRSEGSKNPGATNVLRLAGKKYAALVLLADMLKGTLPVLLAKALGASPLALGLTCLAAVIGHIYPLFFGFKGGKGVATALGTFFGLNFIYGTSILIVWVLVAKWGRFSSLASIISLSLAPFIVLIFQPLFAIFWPLALMTLCILYQHHENINRLLNGLEPKIGFKSK